jgi:hypothetical protein
MKLVSKTRLVESPGTGVVVHMSRFGERGSKDWTSDAYEDRIAP